MFAGEIMKVFIEPQFFLEELLDEEILLLSTDPFKDDFFDDDWESSGV